MSRTNRTLVRSRASLLATSMFATSMLAGAGGLMAAVVAPGVAVAGVCSPAPTADETGGLTLTANPTESCVGGFSGLGYTTVGNLAVTLEPIAPGPGGGSSVGPNHGVDIENTTTPGTLSFVVDTTTAPSGAIQNNTGSGIFMNTAGGNVTVDTGNSANFAGAQVGGSFAGIWVTGTPTNVFVHTANSSTGGTADGIQVFNASGNVSIFTGGTTSGGFYGIPSNSGASFTLTTTGGPTTGAFLGIEAEINGPINANLTTPTSSVNGTAVFLEDNGVGSGALVGKSGVTAINLLVGGNVSSTFGAGIDTEITNGGNNDNINIDLAAQVTTFGTGITANTNGGGNITIITEHGDTVSSTNGDGIDAQTNGGNIFVHLLDGAINSNTSGCGPSGVSGFTIAVAGPAGCSAVALGDPFGMHLVTNGVGTINVITDDDVHNLGPGNAIFASTVDGSNSLQIDANITNTLGDGIHSISSGKGAALVILSGNSTTGSIYSITTTGFGFGSGYGVLVEQTGPGATTATINSVQPGNVTVTNAVGVAGLSAQVTSGNASSVASVNMSGPSGGVISVEGGGFEAGISAIDFAGTATVQTNAGRKILVGTNGGDFDAGVFTVGNVSNAGLGDNNTLVVGNATDFGFNAGVWTLGGAVANVTGGNGDSITVNGNASLAGVGAIAFFNGNASVTFGNTATGATGITVNGNATGDTSVGVLAIGNNTSVKTGSTAITVEQRHRRLANGSASVSVTTGGNVSATNGMGINGTSSHGGVVINVNAGTVKAGNATTAATGVQQRHRQHHLGADHRLRRDRGEHVGALPTGLAIQSATKGSVARHRQRHADRHGSTSPRSPRPRQRLQRRP